MNFLQKVFYNDKPLVLTTDKEAYINDNPFAETFEFFDGASLRSFTQAMQYMDRPGTKGAVIEDISSDSLLTQLHAMYQSIDAGGGVVFNEDNAILMIFRRGKWDLAKGKLDKGETIEECALREVSEETGLQHLSLEEKICDTYHIYVQDNVQLIKRTAWFKMKGTNADRIKPQKEENILEARWVSGTEIPQLAAKSYEAIRDVLKIAGVLR